MAIWFYSIIFERRMTLLPFLSQEYKIQSERTQPVPPHCPERKLRSFEYIVLIETWKKLIVYFWIILYNKWRMLKAKPLISLDLHYFSVLQYNCQTYEDNICQKFQKPSFAMLGAYNMFKNKVYWYRSEVCPEISSLLTFLIGINHFQPLLLF